MHACMRKAGRQVGGTVVGKPTVQYSTSQHIIWVPHHDSHALVRLSGTFRSVRDCIEHQT